MKVHINQIQAGGLHLEGEEDCPIADLASEDVRCAGPLRYSLDVGVSVDALWANGTIAQPLELRCVSCLEPFVHTVEVSPFAVHTELTGPEVVDLTPFVREDILLNLPAYPRCDRHGDRVCSGAKKNDSTDAAAEAKRKREADWAALDQLKLR